MSTTRLAAHTLTAALLGVASLGVMAPSHAADTWTTTTSAEPSSLAVVYGEKISFDVDVDSSSGFTPSDGTTTLLALPAGARAWVPVATSTSPGSGFTDVKPTSNTTYKVVYNGHQATSATDDTYSSSESLTFDVTVARKITHPQSGFVLKGKVSPDYAKKKISIRVSKSRVGGFKKFRKISTDKAGKYRIVLPKRDGTWYWRLSVRGDSRFVSGSYIWQTDVFH
jgi:hypothetical protein